MGTIDQYDFPGYMKGEQGIAQTETKLSFVKLSIRLYCPSFGSRCIYLKGKKVTFSFTELQQKQKQTKHKKYTVNQK